MVVVGFRILPAPVLAVPRRGAINLHASLLPRYRGAAPINWAIMNGERETGVTTFFLEDAVDTGAIILQNRTFIGPEEDAGSLHDRLATMGAQAVLRTVQLIEQGDAPRVPQEHGSSCPAPKIFRDACRIIWANPAEKLRNFIRGLAPHPGAFTMHGERVLKVYRARSMPESSYLPPGEIRTRAGQIEVGTADIPLALIDLQQAGRRRMGVEEFLRGYALVSGDHLNG
jgi:methionyl-tRNA formyltransferase